MIEPTSENSHYATILAAIITIFGAIFATLSGGKEGQRHATEETLPSDASQYIGAAMVDRGTYAAIIDGLKDVAHQVDRLCMGMERLIELTEGVGEKRLREDIREDLKSEVADLAETFRRMMPPKA